MIEDGAANIYMRNQLVGQAKREGMVYWINLSVNREGQANLSKTMNEANLLWHRRFGHLSMTNLYKLYREKMVTGIK